MHKSKLCKNNLISQEDIKLFRETVENIAFSPKKLIPKKYNKFIKYSLVLEAKYNANAKLYYNKNINPKVIKQMQQGNIAIDATIDLHGQTLNEACQSLANFIYYHQNKDYLHIIHGKGYNANNMSKLKTQVAVYLTEHPQISAFCSVPQNAGGTGAVFAKIKK